MGCFLVCLHYSSDTVKQRGAIERHQGCSVIFFLFLFFCCVVVHFVLFSDKVTLFEVVLKSTLFPQAPEEQGLQPRAIMLSSHHLSLFFHMLIWEKEPCAARFTSRLLYSHGFIRTLDFRWKALGTSALRINSVKHLNMTLQYSLPNPRWHLNRLTDVTTGLEMDKTTVWLTLGPRLVLHHLLLYLREQRES